MNLKEIARKFGFTENELKAVLFLVIAALIGLTLKFVRYESKTKRAYDYSEQDSLFNSYYKTNSRVRIKNKSEKKSLDFSEEKSNLNIKFANTQNLVNVNSASSEELKKLPGVGEKTARAIIEYRTRHGKFERKEELMNVKGIGKKKFEKFKSLIKIN